MTGQGQRQAQLAVRAAVLRDTAAAWRLLDPKRLTETFPAWLQVMQHVIGGYHAQSATVAGRFYRSARERHTESPAPASLIRIAPAPDPQWVAKALGYAGPGMLSRDTARPNTALTTTLGTAARITLAGGRDTTLATVRHDPVAVGWYRVTDNDPCDFCRMLSGRGTVYKEHTAQFQAHNHCGCTAAPAFTR